MFAVPCALVLCAQAGPGPKMTEQTLATVTFLQDGTAFCHGLQSDRYVVTAGHCLDDMLVHFSNEKLQARLGSGETVDLPIARMRAVHDSEYAAAMRSFDNDFVVLSLDAESRRPTDIPIASSMVRAHEGEQVEIFSDSVERRTCWVDKVCGSELFYSCSPAPVGGMSGSGIWATRSGRPVLVGIHTREEGRGFHGTDIPTVLGRSSFLFPSTARFSAVFARERRFAYGWGPSCTPRAPFAVEVVNRSVTGVANDAGFHALLVDGSDLLSADLNNGNICTFHVGAASTRLVGCARMTIGKPDQVNAFAALPDGMVAIGEAEKKCQDVAAGGCDYDRASGAIVVVDWNRATGVLGAIVRRRIKVPIKSVRVLARIGPDLVAGGEEGVCVVAGDLCVRLQDRWRVNGLLRLSDNRFLAVGQYQVMKEPIRPHCRWYDKAGSTWSRSGSCKPGEAIMTMASRFGAQGRELSFKAPILVDGRVLVFSSDGQAYRLEAGQAPLPVEVVGAVGFRALGSTQLDDGVRDAARLSADLFAVGANDGGVHFIQARGADRKLVDYVLPNRGLWITALATGPDWLALLSTDGNLSIVRWSGDLSADLQRRSGGVDKTR